MTESSETTEKSEDELLEEMLAEEAAENDETQDEYEDVERPDPEPDIYDAVAEFRDRNPEETDVETEAPEEIEPSADVETDEVDNSVKLGWLDAPVRDVVKARDCLHLANVQARQEMPNHDLGHRWACTCGTVFTIVLNSSAKKALLEVQ